MIDSWLILIGLVSKDLSYYPDDKIRLSGAEKIPKNFGKKKKKLKNFHSFPFSFLFFSPDKDIKYLLDLSIHPRKNNEKVQKIVTSLDPSFELGSMVGIIFSWDF